MITLSDLDQQRFGQVTAKAQVGPGEDIGAHLDACARRQVRLLVARCPTQHLREVQEMERRGFFLADTLVWFRNERIEPAPLRLPEGFRARPATPADAPEVERLARRAFHGFGGHYHADPRLEPALCDEVYASWAARLCASEDPGAHMALITSARDGAIVAFAALQRCDEAEFDATLVGVDPAFRGQGLFAQLLALSLQWGTDQGFTRMLYSTQLTNLAPQRTLCRHGFVPVRSCYTLHKWLD
jgi:GNAT superfamily N-acetyltransferase